MKSEIKNIRRVCRGGAFGKSDHFGFWIYGKRPDGLTRACKNNRTESGGIKIWTYYDIPEENAVDTYITEFSKEEWKLITYCETKHEQIMVSNKILRDRTV